MEVSEIKDGIEEVTLDSWQEFRNIKEFAISPAFIYRGQAKYEWPLQSNLDRLRKKYPRRKNLDCNIPEYFECPPLTNQQHLDAFRRSLRGRIGSNMRPLEDEDECWAIGQHHGLATPLLDWTRSPWVALFFAFEEERIVIDNRYEEPRFRGVYGLSTYWIVTDSNRCGLSIVSPHGYKNTRLISQSALHTRLPQDTDIEGLVRESFRNEAPIAYFKKIKIPNNERHDCLKALDQMNINRMTLFPDVDGAASYVNSLWQPGHENSIPYV